MDEKGEPVVARWSQRGLVVGLLGLDALMVAVLIVAALGRTPDVPIPILIPGVVVELGFAALLVRLWRRSRYTLTDAALVVPGEGSSSRRIPLEEVRGVAIVLVRMGGARRSWCVYLWQPDLPATALPFLGGLSTLRSNGEPPWDRVAASSMGRAATAIYQQSRSARRRDASHEVSVTDLMAQAPPPGGSARWFWSPNGEHGDASRLLGHDTGV